LNAVKEQARTVVCASNLKQWNIIMGFFAADNRDQFPDAQHFDGSPPHGESHGQWWLQPILPYVDNPDILICAKAKAHPETVPGDTFPVPPVPLKENECWGSRQRCDCNNANGEMVWSSYGPNGWLMDPTLPNGVRQTWGAPTSVPLSSFWGKMDRISTPSRVPFYLDSRWVDAWPNDDNEPKTDPDDPTSGSGYMNHFVLDRHNEAVNAVFFDGSGRKVDIKELWSLKWHKTFDTTNLYTQDNAPWPDWLN